MTSTGVYLPDENDATELMHVFGYTASDWLIIRVPVVLQVGWNP